MLGEEAAAGATARYVDSSVERVQARVDGWVEERYVLACNGRAVPLTRTDREGEYVGGVRFKAWNPPSRCIRRSRRQTPLVFDIYDRWNGRSLGGLTHHVAHPGGLQLRTLPGERQRGGGPAAGAVLPDRPHARADGGAGGGTLTRASADAGSASGGVTARRVTTCVQACSSTQQFIRNPSAAKGAASAASVRAGAAFQSSIYGRPSDRRRALDDRGTPGR